jgi:hypothetical protein
MGRRKELVPPGSFEKRQFHNLSDVRREMVTLYWQAKSGRVDSRIAPSLVRLLDLIAHYMVETEAEVQAQRLREQIESARQELLTRGISVPPVIDVVPDRGHQLMGWRERFY